MFKNREKDKAARYLKPRKFLRIRNARVFFALKTAEIMLSRLIKINRGVEVRRHTTLSRDTYEDYGDWEMRIHEDGERFTYTHGKIDFVSFRDIKQAALDPIIREIEKQIEERPELPFSVLEVGCGNGTNLMYLKEKFGDRITLHGFDIASGRIETGKKFWGERLSRIDFKVDDATTLANYADDSMDLVYSVHCLEQLPYYVRDAVRSMRRVARHRIVFVEPVFEFANTAQKLYAILGDQLRTLMPEVEASGMEVVEAYPVEVLANPTNKTGVIVAKP